MIHIPVLEKEVLEYLAPKPNENFIDCTIDGGGHAKAILEIIKPQGKVLGIEIDSEIYQKLKAENLERLILLNDSFVNLKVILQKEKFQPVSGILMDLGMSSFHLTDSGRGFSFLKDEFLDMRYGKSSELTAMKIVNEYPEIEIEKILREFGEERFSRRIAKNIIESRKLRPINTTFELVDIVKRAVPHSYERGRIHPATRTFQALRIIVNQELSNLEKTLPETLEILAKGGRLAVISFHSLEDRIVKNFFREKVKENKLEILTKKPIRPASEEIQINPRSRSARLRVAIKI